MIQGQIDHTTGTSCPYNRYKLSIQQVQIIHTTGQINHIKEQIDHKTGTNCPLNRDKLFIKQGKLII